MATKTPPPAGPAGSDVCGRLPSLERMYATDHIDLAVASGVPDAQWEPYQIDMLDDPATMRIDVKSRQIAWSFTAALLAVIRAILFGQDAIFVSISREESTEKIRYAKAVINANRGPAPRLIRDSLTNIEFSNGARLTSFPAREPRGRARSDVYLDEFAHVRDAGEIYKAAIPILSKGGRLRMGSSPMGAGGIFWEIATESTRKYPGFVRRLTPWWACYAFCIDVPAALRWAGAMTTEERVYTYGNRRLIEIFENIVLEDFQQEYEAVFVDAATAWITWEEIQNNQTPDHVWIRAKCQGQEIGPALEAITEIARLVDSNQIEQTLTAGIDIGRTRDLTEIALLGEAPGHASPLRGLISLAQCPYEEQQEVIAGVLQHLPIARMNIDQTGLGNQLAEHFTRRHPLRVFGLTFTNELKKLWATDAKAALQRGRLPLPADRDLAYQIHSIKRTISGATLRFDTGPNEKHHADQFWALCLGLYARRVMMARADRPGQPTAEVPTR